MSYQDGWAAIHLQMPDRVPRTEYSVESHWELVNLVLGTKITPNSPAPERTAASMQFMKAWNMDFRFNVRIFAAIFGDYRTKMGHAAYAAGAVDYRDDRGSPFQEPEDVLAFDPWEVFGKKDKKEIIRMYDDHYDEQQKQNDDIVNMTGVYVTGMSGAIDLFGWDMLLLAAGVDSDGFGEVMNRYESWIGQYFEALAACKSPVIMVHDDIVWTEGAFLHPDWYRKYLFPNYKKMFAPIIESGKRLIYTSDGNYTEFIDDIAQCGVHGFVMEPLTDMKYIAEKYGKTHVFVGNADTNVLLRGTKEDIYNEVKRCMDIGKSCPGFFMAVGNHIPSNTPIENCLYYNEVYEKLSKR